MLSLERKRVLKNSSEFGKISMIANIWKDMDSLKLLLGYLSAYLVLAKEQDQWEN